MDITTSHNIPPRKKKAVLTGNWAMSLDVLEQMGPGQACMVSDEGRLNGRTALHMAAWVKPQDTAEDVYETFLRELCRKVAGCSVG